MITNTRQTLIIIRPEIEKVPTLTLWAFFKIALEKLEHQLQILPLYWEWMPQVRCSLPILSKKLRRSLLKSPLPDFFFPNESQADGRTTANWGVCGTYWWCSERRCQDSSMAEGRGADDVDLPGSVLCASAVSRIPYFPKVPNPTEWCISCFLIHSYFTGQFYQTINGKRVEYFQMNLT